MIIEYLFKLKESFLKIALKPIIIYVIECLTIKKQHVHKMTIVEMRILKQISGNTCKDKLQNDEICLRYKCLLLMKI